MLSHPQRDKGSKPPLSHIEILEKKIGMGTNSTSQLGYYLGLSLDVDLSFHLNLISHLPF